MASRYEGSDPRKPFDEDKWELYHVAEDFSETVDLADEEPERLRELIELWWSEAERNQVFPLNNQPGRHGDRRFRRERYEYHAGIGVLPPTLAPNLRNRGYRITAELDVPGSGGDGVIVTPRRPLRRLRALPAGRTHPLDLQLPGRADHHRLER